MRYLSVCSGIEAASVAWHRLGWTPIAFSEIDPFACAVLATRYPNVPNLGNMENYHDWKIEAGSVDVLVGGTPCQSFSVAGLRRGLDDPRGNLALIYLGLVDRFRPRYIVWENVPGVLSSNGGRDFGAFIGALAQLGYGFAYRVLDAQYVRVDSHPRAVPQRRRRVFVVGCARGDSRRAAEILLEPEGVRRNPPTRGGAWQSPSQSSAAGVGGDSNAFDWPKDVADTVLAVEGKTYTHEGATFQMHNVVPASVARTLTTSCSRLDSETETLIPFLTTQTTQFAKWPVSARGTGSEDVSFTVTSKWARGYGGPSNGNETQNMVYTNLPAVRRLTPRECERLQGFPDDWTAITYRGKPASDGPRYKAIGNSMAVNVMSWIGERIALYERSHSSP